MSLEHATGRKSSRARHLPTPTRDDDDEVLTFKQWCQLNGIGERTGRRILKRPPPERPVITWLSERRMGMLDEHAVVLHPGPMLRGMEIASAVADSPKAAVLQQVNNGVHMRMAVLFRLLVGTDEVVA